MGPVEEQIEVVGTICKYLLSVQELLSDIGIH